MTNGLTAVDGIAVGHATDLEARTGCTVLLGPFRAACDVRGLATGTRELDVLSPLHIVEEVDAILLTGGSAFGLAAADGVTEWLSERGRGYETRAARVPIVPAAVVYDLGSGDADRRPDAAMGRAACDDAHTADIEEGRVGAGTGASVGNLRGADGRMNGGIGTAALDCPVGRVGALAVVNAFGDVRGRDGRILAGCRDDEGEFVDTARVVRETTESAPGWPTSGAANTTLAAVATDAPLDRPALQSLARMASAAVARRITPSHTPFDGDVSFAVSTGVPPSSVTPGALLGLGSAAVEALERAIERAVTRPTTAQPTRRGRS